MDPCRIAPDRWVVPLPNPSKVAIFHNTNRNALPFLRAVGIKEGSREHRELMRTVRALHRQYLDPFKYVEEQVPDRVDQVIAEAGIRLPWLKKYEDSWPARIYLKRYVDGRRPYLMVPRSTHSERTKELRASDGACPHSTRNSDDPGDRPRNHDLIVGEFLGSMMPSLERHLDAFVQLGIKDRETLNAFLSWPQFVQTQFLDDGHEVLQLTSLEKKGFLWDQGTFVPKYSYEPSTLSTWFLLILS